MPNEHLSSHHEAAERRSEDLEAVAKERLHELEATPEKSVEHAEKQHEQAEAAREVIARHEAEPEPAPAAEAEAKPSFVRQVIDRAGSYQVTMASVQRRLTPAGRQFSRFIHTPAVDRASEALESTVMRPSVAAGAGLTALVVGSFFYYFARTYGYAMRGSEIIVALVVGGILGLIVESVIRAIRPRR